MKKYVLEITVFLSGAIIMIFEIVGSRMLGPYFGSSIFVWTSLIGIVLGGLSLGYYLGGKLADKNTNVAILSLIIFLAGVFIGLGSIVKGFLLSSLQLSFIDSRVGLIIGVSVLFLPVSILLGMVSPYIVKLRLNNLKTSGSTVGNLYAISTLGSIGGTFLAGFYLIPKFGTSKILFILAIILIIISLIISRDKLFKIRWAALISISIVTVIASGFYKIMESKGFIDIDTMYSRVLIYNRNDLRSNREIRVMQINDGHHSAIFLEGDDLVGQYAEYYNLAKFFNPTFKKTLMIGGAGYSYPKYFLLNYPNATMDVVEIDPKVTELAKKYFKLKEDPRLNIYHEDGRVYLNKTDNKYDIIFGDSFSSSNALPYHLTTKEAIQKKFDILNDDGVVIINIISSIEGQKGQFLRAEYKTFKSIFPQVYLFPVSDPSDGDKIQNIMLIAIKSDKHQDLNSSDLELNKYLQNRWKKEIISDMPILTDEYAPVDYYINKMINIYNVQKKYLKS